MKIRFLSTIALFGVLVGFSMNASASSESETLGQLDKGPNVLCRKGNIFDQTFSIRSLSGAACGIKMVAAIAELACAPSNVDKYDDSQCKKKAVKALGGQDPVLVLITEAINYGKTAVLAICKASNIIPALKNVCDRLPKQ